MNVHLVVVRPFAGLTRGTAIVDPARIASVLAGEHRHKVVRVIARADAPPAAAVSARKAGA